MRSSRKFFCFSLKLVALLGVMSASVGGRDGPWEATAALKPLEWTMATFDDESKLRTCGYARRLNMIAVDDYQGTTSSGCVATGRAKQLMLARVWWTSNATE